MEERRARRGFSISAARVQRARSTRGRDRLWRGGLAPAPSAWTLDQRSRRRVDAPALQPLETGLEGVEPRRCRARKLRVRGAGLMRRLERFEALGHSGGLGGVTKLLDLRAQAAHVVAKTGDFCSAGRVLRRSFGDAPARRRRGTAGAQAEFEAHGGAEEDRQRQRAPEGARPAPPCDRKAQARKPATLGLPEIRMRRSASLRPRRRATEGKTSLACSAQPLERRRPALRPNGPGGRRP